MITITMTPSEIIISPEPLDLRAGIPVHDIALLVLEVPRDDEADDDFGDADDHRDLDDDVDGVDIDLHLDDERI